MRLIHLPVLTCGRDLEQKLQEAQNVLQQKRLLLESVSASSEEEKQSTSKGQAIRRPKMGGLRTLSHRSS